MDLTKEQKIAISVLATSNVKDKFYWTGGTLLSYHYLKHRRSEDLDFFSEKEFSLQEVNYLIQRIQKEAGFRKVGYHKIFDRFEFLFENGKSLRIEFVYYNSDKKTLSRKREKLLGIMIDSLEDIAANKTMAYFDRNEPKDLFDIYFLIQKSGFTAKKLLALAQQKFGVEFNQGLFWSEVFKSLSFLSTLKPLMLGDEIQQQELLRKIESYFKDESERFLRKSLK